MQCFFFVGYYLRIVGLCNHQAALTYENGVLVGYCSQIKWKTCCKLIKMNGKIESDGSRTAGDIADTDIGKGVDRTIQDEV